MGMNWKLLFDKAEPFYKYINLQKICKKFFALLTKESARMFTMFFRSASDHDFISKDEKKVQVSGFAVNILYLLMQKFTRCI